MNKMNCNGVQNNEIYRIEQSMKPHTSTYNFIDVLLGKIKVSQPSRVLLHSFISSFLCLAWRFCQHFQCNLSHVEIITRTV